MSIWVKIGLVVIILHLLLGFGWLIYQLSPRKKSNPNESSENQDAKTHSDDTE